MSKKHIYNSSEGLVLRSLQGAVALNPAIALHTQSKSVYIHSNFEGPSSGSQPNIRARVAVIAGGGAGHEPAHAGYTGRGMLATSVSGDIFASPSTKQILQTIWLASSSGTYASPPPPPTSSDSALKTDSSQAIKPVLVIINNYTGDRLNFGLAIEKARANNVEIDAVVVADDVSLLSSSSSSRGAEKKARASKVGARGLGANILICKLIGAAAERGLSLSQLKVLGDAAVANLASVGVGLEHCHVPGRSNGDVDGNMCADECEIGLGLHNEPGAHRKALHSAEEVIEEMLGLVFAAKKDSWPVRSEGEEYVLFINNLGGMSQLELGAIVAETLCQLEKKDIRPSRVYAASYMTSLNAPGFSISLLNLSSIFSDLLAKGVEDIHIEELKMYLDDPTDATAWVGARTWPSRVGSPSQGHRPEVSNKGIDRRESSNLILPSRVWKHYLNAIQAACQEVLKVEADLTKWDTEMGDGDCGVTFANGAKAILKLVNESGGCTGSLGSLLGQVGEVLEDNMGGTIGALFAIFFTALHASITFINGSEPSLEEWARAVQSGVEALNRHTPAQPGDRTLIDSLQPFSVSLSAGSTFAEAVKKAREGAESTKKLRPVLGRAAYVGCDVVEGKKVELPPDPGAMGVVAILEGLLSSVEGR